MHISFSTTHKTSKHIHHKRKMKAFEAFKNRNTQGFMKQAQGTNFAKNRNFAHESIEFFSSCHLKFLPMVRAKLQASLSDKKKK